MLGFRRGDVICLLIPDSVVWLQFLFSASQLGVLVVPISTRYRDLEIAHVLETSRAKGFGIYPEVFEGGLPAHCRDAGAEHAES